MKGGRITVLVGGGSGGHIFPLVAVGEELAKKKIPFVYIGSKNSLEEKIIKGQGWEFIPIDSGKWRRYVSPQSLFNNLVGVFGVIKGFFQAVRVLKNIDAGLVVSKGGFVAVPVLYAARVLKRPVIVHESDSVMGVANRIGSRFASKVLTAFDVNIFPEADDRYQKVGIPIRRSLKQAATLRSPKKERPVILVLPGSQGASAINHYIKQTLRQLLRRYDIVHLTGEGDYQDFANLRKSLPNGLRERYRPYRFIDRELPYYYQSADLLVVRASATIAAEAALFSKPLYIIPLPGSANDHQQHNARRLEQAGAAVVREQYQLSTDQFLSDINSLLSDQGKLDSLGENLANYFDSSNATAKTLTVIEDA